MRQGNKHEENWAKARKSRFGEKVVVERIKALVGGRLETFPEQLT
jgi:hypothetical protein